MAEEELAYWEYVPKAKIDTLFNVQNSFLCSDTICLQTASSSRKFRIHEDLLASKCKAIHAAFTGDFKEKKDGAYTIQDTTDETVARFVEWAYKNDYSVEVRFSGASSLSEKMDEEGRNCSLLVHAQIYVFAHVYGIESLQSLAYNKLTANIIALHPNTLDYLTAIIRTLNTTFSSLHQDDKLLDWLGHYAAWLIEHLKSHPEFHAVLPKLAYSIIRHMPPAKLPPWRV